VAERSEVARSRAGQALDWGHVLARAVRRLPDNDYMTLAAGIALYAVLAVVPCVAAVVAIYGLAMDPGDIERQLADLLGVLPLAVRAFLSEQLASAASQSSGDLGLALATSIGFAVLAARGAVAALAGAFNHIQGERERRGFFHRLALSIALAAGMLLAICIAVATLVVMPALLTYARLELFDRIWISWGRWPVLLAFGTVGLSVLYRLGPSRRWPRGPRPWWLDPGALVAMALWLAASVGLSTYVSRIADYDLLYGAFGGVMVLLLWFYLSALAILVGALVNDEVARMSRGRVSSPKVQTPGSL
jgi:membrane protein